MIHGWAMHNGWKNIKVLLKNIKSDNLKPNYQTYAGLLVACGNMGDVKKTEEVIKEMLENVIIDFLELLVSDLPYTVTDAIYFCVTEKSDRNWANGNLGNDGLKKC